MRAQTKVVQGAAQRVANAYNGIFCGTIGIGFPGVPIYQQQQQCLEVIVQNDPGSANIVYIGNELQGQYFALSAGESITIPINDLNKVHARTDGGAATVNFIAMI